MVKDFLKDLIDEGKIKCEKIGSGNWYWCFPSDEQAVLKSKIEEKTKLEETVTKNEAEIEALKEAIEEIKKRKEECESDAAYITLLSKVTSIDSEVKSLKYQKHNLEQAVSGDANGFEDMTKNLAIFKHEAEMWTDNIYILEAYLRDKLAVDRESMVAMQREYYGDEFVEGEGLREVAFE